MHYRLILPSEADQVRFPFLGTVAGTIRGAAIGGFGDHASEEAAEYTVVLEIDPSVRLSTSFEPGDRLRFAFPGTADDYVLNQVTEKFSIWRSDLDRTRRVEGSLGHRLAPIVETLAAYWRDNSGAVDLSAEDRRVCNAVIAMLTEMVKVDEPPLTVTRAALRWLGGVSSEALVGGGVVGLASHHWETISTLLQQALDVLPG